MHLTFDFIDVTQQLPPINTPVLAWWIAPHRQTDVMRTSIYTGRSWNVPGYQFSEYLITPTYWAEHPVLSCER